MGAITPTAYKTGAFFNEKPSWNAKETRPRFKVGYITLPATADDTDTTTIDMYDNFGISKLLAIQGFTHSTTDSVVVEEDPTTAVSGTLLTVTVGGITDNKKRFFVIYGI